MILIIIHDVLVMCHLMMIALTTMIDLKLVVDAVIVLWVVYQLATVFRLAIIVQVIQRLYAVEPIVKLQQYVDFLEAEKKCQGEAIAMATQLNTTIELPLLIIPTRKIGDEACPELVVMRVRYIFIHTPRKFI